VDEAVLMQVADRVRQTNRNSQQKLRWGIGILCRRRKQTAHAGCTQSADCSHRQNSPLELVKTSGSSHCGEQSAAVKMDPSNPCSNETDIVN
jgi:hypothetical protein